MKELISQKIDELIELAKIAEDNNTRIVLLTLRGSQFSGTDGILAAEVQRYTKEVLIPLAQKELEIRKAFEN